MGGTNHASKSDKVDDVLLVHGGENCACTGRDTAICFQILSDSDSFY
jgi:hypothetical protein